MQRKLKLCSVFLFIFLTATSVIAVEVPIKHFPLDRYSQNIGDWINPSDPDYDTPLIDSQEQKNLLKEYCNHIHAPWNRAYVEAELGSKLKDQTSEQKILDTYDNSRKTSEGEIGYGANFKRYNEQWIRNIVTNMNLKQFLLPLKYAPNNRGIAVKNLNARALPTNDPYFYDFSLAGQGYPFDNLQESALWVGTPVYIIGYTLDQHWCYVLTPHKFIAWVESDGIAKTNEQFVDEWYTQAKQGMVAITRTNVGVFDTEKNHRFNAYVGTVFPCNYSVGDPEIKTLIPVADAQHNAQMLSAELSNEDAAVIPLTATPRNFATVISTLLGRPYGWGNMYFYNDCSMELQSLYAPFGIWLPRNSASQAEASKGMIDKSSVSVPERLEYLIENGRKFTTIVYINGHVMLYIGNHSNPNSNTPEPMAMTYQNIWGLRPADSSYRSVIGQSVFFPLLINYPEDTNLTSLASRKYFKVIYLTDKKDSSPTHDEP